MGGSSSKEETARNIDYFAEGLTALREGRFTYSEIYFHQLLKNHPGRAFWSDLLTAAFRPSEGKKGGKTDVESKWVEDLDEDGFGGKGDRVGDYMKSDVELPVDDRLADVMEYAWLTADIAFAYLKDKRRMSQSLALVYSHFVCVHMQLLLHFLTMYLEEQSIRGGLEGYWSDDRDGADGGDNPLVGNGPQPVDLTVVGPILELLECQCKYLWYSFSANYTLLALMMAKDTPDAKARHAILSNAIDSCKVLEDTLWRKASENPRDSLSALILRHMPTASRNRAKKNDELYQPELENKNLYYCSVTGATPVGQETFLFVSRNFNPAISVLLPLTTVLPVKLYISGQNNVAPISVVQPPNQRSAYHYLSWIASGESNVTPGQSDNLNVQLSHTDNTIEPLATEENCLTCIAIFLAEAELMAASEEIGRAEDIRAATMDMAAAMYGEQSREMDVIQNLAEDFKQCQLAIPSERDCLLKGSDTKKKFRTGVVQSASKTQEETSVFLPFLKFSINYILYIHTHTSVFC
eukprot:gene3633-2568_t